MRGLRHLFIGTVIAIGGACPARADQPHAIEFGTDLAASGWRHVAFPGRIATMFTADGRDALRVRAEGSSSLIYRMVERAAQHHRRLSWRWRVDRPVPATDLSRRGGDDRSLGVYAIFAARGDGELGKRLGLPPQGLRRDGFVLVYVWGGNRERGALIPSPYEPRRVGQIILRPAGTDTAGAWLREEVDLAADFRRAFAADPPPLRYLAIAADSDDTRSLSDARIADLTMRQ